jgi:ribosomal protein S18 acetylase RimI-like enzyme
MTVSLRLYHPDDFEAVVRLWYEAWHHNFPELSHPWTYAQWREHFEDRVTAHASIWIAERAGLVAGFLVLQENQGYLDQIFVAPAFQHQGIGTLLINKAKALSPASLFLDTLQSNTKARRFYEKHGFQPGRVGINPNSGLPNIEYQWSPSTEIPA